MDTSKTGLDAQLANNLRQAKSRSSTKPCFFALILKGSTSGKLLVDTNKVPDKSVAAAKKETGGSAVIRGLCYGGDGGTLVFETAKVPAPAWTPLVKRLANEGAGVSITPVFLLGRDESQLSDEAGQESPGVPVDDKAAWEARLGEVKARLKAAAAAKHPAARQMITGVNEAQTLFSGGDPVRAGARLSQVEALLAPGATAPSASPTESVTVSKDTVMQRLSALGGAIKAALPGPDGARVKALFTAINGLVKNGEVVEAGKVLDDLEALLKSSTAPAPPDGDAVVKRFKALAAPLKTAMGAQRPDIQRIQSFAVAVNGFLKNKEYAKANKILDALESLLTTPPPTPATTAAPSVLLAALDEFRGASDTVDGQIAKLQTALRTTKDKELITIAEYGLNALTGNHKSKLIALEIELRRAAGPNLLTVAAKALPVVAAFRAHLTGNEQIDVCDSNPFGVTVTIKSTLGGALERLEAVLKTVAQRVADSRFPMVNR
jgi:hypothetical protein